MEEQTKTNTGLVVFLTAITTAIVIGIGGYFFLKGAIQYEPVADEASEEGEIAEDPSDEPTVVASYQDETVVKIMTEEISFTNTKSRRYPTIRVWRQVGDADPEVILDAVGGVDEYPGEFKLSPNNESLYINLESKLQALDLETLELSDVYVANLQVSSYILSEDGETMLIWDQRYTNQDDPSKLMSLDLQSGETTLLFEGYTDQRSEFYHIEHWLEDEDKLLLRMSGGAFSLYFYMSLDDFSVHKIDSDGTHTGYSSTGRFFLGVDEFIEDACNDMMGTALSTFEILDFDEDEIAATFGQIGRRNYLVAFSPDDSQLIYKSAPQNTDREKCSGVNDDWTYYLLDLWTLEEEVISEDDLYQTYYEWHATPLKVTQYLTDSRYGALLNGVEFVAPYKGLQLADFYYQAHQ